MITCVVEAAVHMLGMAGTAVVAYGKGVRVAVTGGAIIGEIVSPEVVCATVKIVRASITTITTGMTCVSAAASKRVVGKVNTAAAERTDIVGAVEMFSGRGSARSAPCSCGIVTRSTNDRINAKV